MILPQARQEKLLVRELADETLVYDLARGKVHCLNRTAALVWRCCDGRTTLAAATQQLTAELGKPTDAEVVRLALEQLSRRNLLRTPVTAPAQAHRAERRELLKKMAVALAALPAIMTLAAPASAATLSPAAVQTQQELNQLISKEAHLEVNQINNLSQSQAQAQSQSQSVTVNKGGAPAN